MTQSDAPPEPAAGLPRWPPRRRRRQAAEFLVFGLWALTFCNFHWWLAAHGPQFILRVPLVFFAALALFVLLRFPPPSWFIAMAVFIGLQVLMVPFSTNTGVARVAVRSLLLYYVLALGTVVFLRRPRDLLPVFYIYLLSHVWWAFNGLAIGYAPWDPIMGNSDGYGPYMVMGMGFGFYFGLASRKPRIRKLAYAIAIVCVLGVVTSFARGAVLSAAALALIIWARSPHKGRTAVAAILGMAVVTIAAGIFFPEGAFWAEMKSSFTEGTSEGTGEDRWVLWQAAIDVFKAKPVFGTGPLNFGPFAASYFEVGEVGGRYGANPLTLYDRNLHSLYFQLLSEDGLVGIAAFLTVLVDFWRRNARLRSARYREAWEFDTGGAFDLKSLSLALEAAMLGYLLTGVFFAQLYNHWFFSIVALNVVLHTRLRKAVRAMARRPIIPAGGSPS